MFGVFFSFLNEFLEVYFFESSFELIVVKCGQTHFGLAVVLSRFIVGFTYDCL